jgi:hypothetical protein
MARRVRSRKSMSRRLRHLGSKVFLVSGLFLIWILFQAIDGWLTERAVRRYHRTVQRSSSRKVGKLHFPLSLISLRRYCQARTRRR